jgi:hypothetical protein
MMKYIASMLIVLMTFNASAADNRPVFLPAGARAPYEGLLIKRETLEYLNEKLDRIDAAESALVKQNDYLIDAQIKIVTLEFERDNARATAKEKNIMSGVFWVILGVIAGGARR